MWFHWIRVIRLKDRLLLLTGKLRLVIILKLRSRILYENGIHHGDRGHVGEDFIVVRIDFLLLLRARHLLRRSFQLILHSFLFLCLLGLLTFIHRINLHILLRGRFLHRNVADPLRAAGTLILTFGATGLIDAVLLFLRLVRLLEHVHPSLGLKIEGSHVVELVGDFVDACEYNHMTLIDACTMSTSTRNINIRIHAKFNLFPFVFGEVECPQIEKFVVVI